MIVFNQHDGDVKEVSPYLQPLIIGSKKIFSTCNRCKPQLVLLLWLILGVIGMIGEK